MDLALGRSKPLAIESSISSAKTVLAGNAASVPGERKGLGVEPDLTRDVDPSHESECRVKVVRTD